MKRKEGGREEKGRKKERREKKREQGREGRSDGGKEGKKEKKRKLISDEDGLAYAPILLSLGRTYIP